jgi:type IV pilus assembly protein PilP
MRLAAIPGAYDATGKIDPFEPLVRENPVLVKKKKDKKRIPRSPLERIDLSQLKLVGIILASSGNRALIEESSGKGYVIKKGTYIGLNSGKVVKIIKEKVVVEEEFEDVFGKSKLRQREIKLPKPPGEF